MARASLRRGLDRRLIEEAVSLRLERTRLTAGVDAAQIEDLALTREPEQLSAVALHDKPSCAVAMPEDCLVVALRSSPAQVAARRFVSRL